MRKYYCKYILDTMNYSPVLFTILANIISSDPSPHMVVQFILVPIHWHAQWKLRDSKKGQTTTKKFQAQRRA